MHNLHLPRAAMLALSTALVCFLFLHLDFGLLEKLYWNNNSQYYLDSTKGGLGRIFQAFPVE